MCDVDRFSCVHAYPASRSIHNGGARGVGRSEARVPAPGSASRAGTRTDTGTYGEIVSMIVSRRKAAWRGRGWGLTQYPPVSTHWMSTAYALQHCLSRNFCAARRAPPPGPAHPAPRLVPRRVTGRRRPAPRAPALAIAASAWRLARVAMGGPGRLVSHPHLLLSYI